MTTGLRLSPEQLSALKRQQALDSVQREPELPTIPESEILRACLAALELHPRVAWCARINSGTFEVSGRFVRASFKGCSDIIGMLKGGRFLACEVKSENGELTADQAAFGAAVEKDGGLFIVARSVDDVMRGLANV